jgi:hypothetical protein
MNKGELRNTFLTTLNRDDCTDDLADLFISQGLGRVERRLRSPMQKTTVTITVGDDWPGYTTIPNDFLSMDYIKVNGVTLGRRTPTRVTECDERGPNAFGWSDYYVEDAKIKFLPSIAEGDIIEVRYYSTFDRGDADTDVTTASVIIPDVVMYAALIPAGVYFSDERLAEFKTMYGELLIEVIEQVALDEMSGGVTISNPYEGIV